MQEKIKYGNTMTQNELELYRKEAYKEIIDWYKATEDAQNKMNPSHFIVLTYDDLIHDLEGSIERCFALSDKTISNQFRETINEKTRQTYVKKHQNKTVIDFGFNTEEIKKILILYIKNILIKLKKNVCKFYNKSLSFNTI